MNQLTSRLGVTSTPATSISLRNPLSRAALTVLGLFILLFAAALPARASSGCYTYGGGSVRMPLLDHGGALGPNTIVGLWHVTYTTTSGAPFGVSLKQWHSDGTEFENIDHPAVVGNICFGVWKQVDFRSVRLHHTGWTFDNRGNPSGSFTIDETDTVSPNGMGYTGSFTFKVFDTNGDYIAGTETTGTIAATRITVN
jgi:hypothetical protein